jgi:hypothetical protein
MKSSTKFLISAAVVLGLSGLGYLVYDTARYRELTIDKVTVSPLAGSLPVDYTANLTAFVTYSDGSIKDVTAEAVWYSGNPGIAAVTGPGSVLGVASGATYIKADYLGVVNSVAVTVA